MAISDTVVGNLTTIYLSVIAGLKLYGLVAGKSFTGVFVLATSTAVVMMVLIGTLAWDVSKKVRYALSARDHQHGIVGGVGGGGGEISCKGGICWHGVAVKSPASQVRFRLPQQYPFDPM